VPAMLLALWMTSRSIWMLLVLLMFFLPLVVVGSG
jgi:hypothetical protein